MVLPLILGLPYTVAAGILWGQRISRNLSTPNGIVCSVSFVHHEHREELGRFRLAGIGADAEASVLDEES